MRQVIETYAIVWAVAIIMVLAIAFTSINMHTIQARKIYNDIRAEIQSSNGALVDSSDTLELKKVVRENAYWYECKITRQTPVAHNKADDAETFIYNSIYRIELIYHYAVPLFGAQTYPLAGYAI